MKQKDLEKLIKKYGPNMTFGELLVIVKAARGIC